MRESNDKSRKGASSILVILLLVVLVVFGIAALTTALSNVRLGQKAADWNDKYYSAEAKANEMYAQIDRAVTSVFTKSANIEELKSCISKLDFDVEIDTKNNDAIVFRYEAWEEDVEISVVLSYNKLQSSFTVEQFKALQK